MPADLGQAAVESDDDGSRGDLGGQPAAAVVGSCMDADLGVVSDDAVGQAPAGDSLAMQGRRSDSVGEEPVLAAPAAVDSGPQMAGHLPVLQQCGVIAAIW